jgi:hypothetical protein
MRLHQPWLKKVSKKSHFLALYKPDAEAKFSKKAIANARTHVTGVKASARANSGHLKVCNIEQTAQCALLVRFQRGIGRIAAEQD